MIKKGFELLSKESISDMIDLAIKSANDGNGGPFGAMIFNSETVEIVSVATNTVLSSKDPTAHGEINAIRLACQKLGKSDLRGYSLLTTSEPCPMCMAALKWAYIDEWGYIASTKTADIIGFNDINFYKSMKKVMDRKRVKSEYRRLYRYEDEGLYNKIKQAFTDYKENNREMY